VKRDLVTNISATNVCATASGYASIGTDRHLRLWDRRGAPLAAQKVATGQVSLVALAAPATGPWVVTGTKGLVLWDASTAKKLGARKGHGSKGRVADLVVLGDGITFVSAAQAELATEDNSVIFWELTGEAPVRKVLLRGDPSSSPCEVVRLVRAAGSDDLFALGYARRSRQEGSTDGCHVFHLAPGSDTAERILELHSYQSDHYQLAAAQGCVVVTDLDQATGEFEIRSHRWDGSVQAALPPIADRPSLAMSPDGARLAVGSSMGVAIYSAADLALITSCEADYAPRARMHFTPSGAELLAASTQGLERYTE
jgi:hypothetical protein